MINVRDIVRFIKSRRLAWLRHVKRMPKEVIPMPLRILDGEVYGTRKRGRTRKIQNAEEDGCHQIVADGDGQR